MGTSRFLVLSVLALSSVLAACGSDSGDSSGGGSGSGGTPPAVTPIGSTPNNPKRVFITSASYTGNMGGIANADTYCRLHAEAASLGGTWRAYLSTNTFSAKNRLTPGAGPYYLVDNTTKVFDSTESIPTALASINKDQTGAVVPSGAAANTGTYSDGAALPNYTCNNWTSASSTDFAYTGWAHWTSLPAPRAADWSSWGNGPCNFARRIYCFEL